MEANVKEDKQCPIRYQLNFQLQCNFLLTVWNNRQVWLHPNLIINKKNFIVSLLIKVFKSHSLLLDFCFSNSVRSLSFLPWKPANISSVKSSL